MSLSTDISSTAENLIKRELAGEFPAQKSQEWFNKRAYMLTATNISSVLDCNIYKSKYELMLSKISNVNVVNSVFTPATQWGNRFENIALKFYEFYKNVNVYSIGLVSHSKYSWLGASPDGLLKCGKLLEIKCPFSRKSNGKIPFSYWIQMQIQLEVCDLDECDYLECKFYKYENKEDYDADDSDSLIKGEILPKASEILETAETIIYYKLENIMLKTVTRDKLWFSTNLKCIQKFYSNMTHYKQIESENVGKGICEFNKSLQTTKRKRNIYQVATGNRNIKRRRKLPLSQFIDKFELPTITNWKYWVSATAIRNYVIDDPMVDWLEYHKNSWLCLGPNTNQKNNNKPPTFEKYIMQNGIKFETKTIQKLMEKFPNEVVSIGKYETVKSHTKFLETLYHIQKGTPIIYQGVLHDYSKKIFGMPDLLVRSDYMNKIFNKPVIKPHKKWHYRVVEIKMSSLVLCADGIHLRNSKILKTFKSQLYIYNTILGSIQNYTPAKSYVIGENWQYVSKRVFHRGSSFDRPAIVNFKNRDNETRKKVSDAIKWIRKMRNNGKAWEVLPPTVPQLRPNMCIINNKWQHVKKDIATRQNDITQLWMCGNKNREFADVNGIVNWRTHPNLTSEMLGITGDSTANTLQLIIDVNQDNSKLKPIYPKKIESNLYNWRDSGVDVYVDFETISSVLVPFGLKNSSTFDCDDSEKTHDDSHTTGDFIFMIGVGYEIQQSSHNSNSKNTILNMKHLKNVIPSNTWHFKCFISDDMSIVSERKMFQEFHDFIYNIKAKNVWHWSSAEPHLYNTVLSRHINYIDTYKIIYNWCDLLKLFKTEPIVTRGSLCFKLKSVAGALHKLNIIESQYSNEMDNGLDAMMYAYNEYVQMKTFDHENNMISNIMKNIRCYNEIDCKVLWEILTYFRLHH
jgi:putative phage-type endonuclease